MYRIQAARVYEYAQSSLAVAAGRIVAALPQTAPSIDLSDHLILPGLINAHDHLQLNAIPALSHTEYFADSYEWILAFQQFFSEPQVADAVARPSAQRHWHGGLKNLLSGATTVAHHDPMHPILQHADFPVRVPPIGWSHSPGLSGGFLPPDHPARALTYGIDPHSSYRATPADQAWIIHLAEGHNSIAAAELPWLAAQGCLQTNTLLVHAVGLTVEQQRHVIAAGAGVIWCPASNLGMLGCTLDPRPYVAAGCIALGSDSRISGARDLLEELRIAAANSEIPAQALLRMVTSDAARLLQFSDIGRIQEGYRADLVVLRDPGGDPATALLSATRAELRAVVRDGRPVLCDPDLGEWMALCGVQAQPIRIDGHAKLIDKQILGVDGAIELEPGIIVVDGF